MPDLVPDDRDHMIAVLDVFEHRVVYDYSARVNKAVRMATLALHNEAFGLGLALAALGPLIVDHLD
jgi:hypothetical protein